MIKSIKILLWSLVAVPLIVDTDVFFPYIAGKNLFIETVLVLASILFLINFIYSRGFREEIIGKIQKYIKNPLVLSVIAFFFVFIISAVSAVDKYTAFWGELVHAEGLAGMMFFFTFFILSLLVFEIEDWLWFFKLSLFTALILLGKEFSESLGGISRPSSFVGNPTFLAGYLLFSIASSLIILEKEEDKFWKYFSLFIMTMSLIGIFIAETRGTILGLGFGFFSILIYCFFRGRGVYFKKFSLRRISFIILCTSVLFAGIFVVTRGNEFWQKVPGLSRVAVINTGNIQDLSTTARLIAYKSSLEAVNPIQNGWKKLLIGWGPENYILAFGRYFNPALYKIQTDWDDRPHDKLIEVLVTNGLFGLLAYLSIWFFFFRLIFKQKKFSLINAGILFFGVSFFTHLLFVFDQISTLIPSYAIMAFAVFFIDYNAPVVSKMPQEGLKSNQASVYLVAGFFIVLTFFLSFVFVSGAIFSYVQTKSSFSLIDNLDIETAGSRLDSILALDTTAQRYVLKGFLQVAVNHYNKNPGEARFNLLNETLSKGEEYAKSRPDDFIFIASLADTFSKEGNNLKNQDYLKKGEEYFRWALTFSPDRQDINYGLAFDLVYQKKYAEAFPYFEKSFASDSGLFRQDGKMVENVYLLLIRYFYQQKDKVDFINTAIRLKENSYAGSATLDQIINYLNTKGVWPSVNFD